MQRGLRRLTGMTAGVLLLALTLAAAPTTQKSAGKSPLIESAVAELKREYAAHTKKASAEPVRIACDYFKDPSAIPADALLIALEKPLPGDNRQAAYVKWQLLSGLPAQLDESTAQRLAKVYERSPVPNRRYAMSPQEQKLLDGLLSGARSQDDVALTEKLEEAANRAFEADHPVVAYRDELYRRLPLGREKLVAGLRDAAARIALGAQKDALAEALSTDLKSWAVAGSPTKAEVREVGELFGKLRFVESPPYYKSAGLRRGKLAWVTDTDTLLTKKKLSDLHKVLLDAAGVSESAEGAGDKKKSAGGKQAAKQNGKDKKTGNDP